MSYTTQLLLTLEKATINTDHSASNAHQHSPTAALSTGLIYNGHSSVESYAAYLHELYLKCQGELTDLLQHPADSFYDVCMELHKLHDQLDHFITLYLSTQNDYILFLRVQWEGVDYQTRYLPETYGQIRKFMEAEGYFLTNLRYLLTSSIKTLRLRSQLERQKRALLKQQGEGLPALFDAEGKPLICWKKDKVDLVEIVASLHLLGALERSDKQQLSRKDLFDFFAYIFNFELKNPENTLEAARNRKGRPDKFSAQLGNCFVQFSQK